MKNEHKKHETPVYETLSLAPDNETGEPIPNMQITLGKNSAEKGQ
jgi:hypothetical protein